MEIENIPIGDVFMYENNPRNNKQAVKFVANSIKEFGFKQPIVIDRENTIVCGHTRYLALIQLGYETVPCVRADDLTDEQIRAYRLADNKVAEMAGWDYDKLHLEMDELAEQGFDLSQFGFGAVRKIAPQEEEPVTQPEVKQTEPVECASVIRENKEISLEDFSDEQYEYKCPCCGFHFNA